MQLNEFQQWYVDFQRNYKVPEEHRLSVLVMGLAGEVGEVTEIVKKSLRDGREVDTTAMTLELGDVLVYLSLVADYYGIKLDDIANAVIEKNKVRAVKNELQKTKEEREVK